MVKDTLAVLMLCSKHIFNLCLLVSASPGLLDNDISEAGPQCSQHGVNALRSCDDTYIEPSIRCQTLITLTIESVISSRKITLTLPFQQRCSLTYSYNIVFLHSPGCINILPTCQTLITLITLITESDISSRKITLTLSFQQRYLLTRSYNIVFLYYLGCINILPSRETLITLITLITESVVSSRKVTLTLSFRRRNLLTCSYDIVSLHHPGCINILPTCQTLITLITESFMSSPKLTLAGVGCLQLSGIHRFKVSGGDFD